MRVAPSTHTHNNAIHKARQEIRKNTTKESSVQLSFIKQENLDVVRTLLLHSLMENSKEVA
jgi:hypothetical protein